MTNNINLQKNHRNNMYTFILSLLLLIGGYFIYGRYVTRVFGIDTQRKTPAYLNNDGVDFIPMPTWKLFMRSEGRGLRRGL